MAKLGIRTFPYSITMPFGNLEPKLFCTTLKTRYPYTNRTCGHLKITVSRVNSGELYMIISRIRVALESGARFANPRVSA